MARVEMRVSDLSRTLMPDDDEAVALIVEHPVYGTLTLDAVRQDLEGKLPDPQAFVGLNINNQRYLMSVSDFNNLFTGDQEANAVLEQVAQEQRSQRGSGKRAAASGSTGTRERIDYSSPEHAGKPHRGTISEAEKAYVRDNLDEVNRRNREQGHPEIDPNDSRMAARYGFEPPVNGSATPERTETTER